MTSVYSYFYFNKIKLYNPFYKYNFIKHVIGVFENVFKIKYFEKK